MRMSLNIAKFQDSKVTLSSAGMPPAYYFDSQKNEIEEILVPGLPLGSVKNADYDLVNLPNNPTFIPRLILLFFIAKMNI